MNKIFSFLIATAFVFIVASQFLTTSVNAQDSKAITIEESNKIFSEFGGKKGEVPVTMFVTSWCPVCTALEKTFKNSNISYAKADVESNRDAMLHYQKLVRGRTAGVPATLVGDELFMGFDTANIVKAIKKLREIKTPAKVQKAT